MSGIHYFEPGDADNPGRMILVSTDNPLPVTGGGGMQPSDVNATAPLDWDSATSTMSLSPAGAVADATDEASAVTQLNALLASLRAAGIIAGA